jgi:hypothetical protein
MMNFEGTAIRLPTLDMLSLKYSKILKFATLYICMVAPNYSMILDWSLDILHTMIRSVTTIYSSLLHTR